jgi:hypothetical protein
MFMFRDIGGRFNESNINGKAPFGAFSFLVIKQSLMLYRGNHNMRFVCSRVHNPWSTGNGRPFR